MSVITIKYNIGSSEKDSKLYRIDTIRLDCNDLKLFSTRHICKSLKIINYQFRQDLTVIKQDKSMTGLTDTHALRDKTHGTCLYATY